MFDGLRDRVLRLMRVPHEPEPPSGAPGSIRVFRAGRNFYKLKLIGWGVGQVGALVGIIVSLGFLDRVDRTVTETKSAIKAAREAPPKPTPPPAGAVAAPASVEPASAMPQAPTAEPPVVSAETTKPVAKKSARKRRGGGEGLKQAVSRSPGWVWPLLKLFEYAGIVLYVAQIPLTYAMVRLDWEQRWYIVTDRSLRIRTGLTTVLESTMSFANIQQVVVTQGPLQRFLGLADVRVQSAGGAGEAAEAHGGQPSLHTGIFHGVEHATEIRDLILERLRLFRQTGLGDPDDHPLPAESSLSAIGDASAAAQELLAEVRNLRATLSPR